MLYKHSQFAFQSIALDNSLQNQYNNNLTNHMQCLINMQSISLFTLTKINDKMHPEFKQSCCKTMSNKTNGHCMSSRMTRHPVIPIDSKPCRVNVTILTNGNCIALQWIIADEMTSNQNQKQLKSFKHDVLHISR